MKSKEKIQKEIERLKSLMDMEDDEIIKKSIMLAIMNLEWVIS